MYVFSNCIIVLKKIDAILIDELDRNSHFIILRLTMVAKRRKEDKSQTSLRFVVSDDVYGQRPRKLKMADCLNISQSG